MKAAQINPDFRSKIRFMPNFPIGKPWQIRALNKLMGFAPDPKINDLVTREIISFGNGSGVRVFTPMKAASEAALLFIHGGGMVIGSASQDDKRLADLAAVLGITVVSVEYRLAPENPFPAPLDDCFGAWQWLGSEAQARNINPARVVIGGQSAGGGLAASLALKIRDLGGVQPAGQWLFCPMLDDRTAANRELDKVRHFVWHNKSNFVGWGSYLAQAPGLRQTPKYAVPSREEDLSGLPPAWIGVGDIELFYKEDIAYAKALQAAGVECKLNVVEGGPHAFETFAPDAPASRAYIADATSWLKQRLGV